MKHLLGSIESRALDLSGTNIDITQLLTNVRDTRDLKSAEGFTEAMEKVLHDLRGTEHAVPFLKPVKRSEAPNYDAVIKNPMDLASMARKIRTHQYKTKRDFVNDLNLIWDNCLAYNSEPTHPLRRTTVFMRKKADQAVEKYLGGSGGDSRATPIPVINVHQHASRDHHNHGHGALTNGHAVDRVDQANPKLRLKLTPRQSMLRAKSDWTDDSRDSTPVMNGATPEFKSPTANTKPKSVRNHKTSRAQRQSTIQAFEDSPAIIRDAQTMKQYYDFDYALQPHLDSFGAGPSKQANGGLTNGLGMAGMPSLGVGFLSLDGRGPQASSAELKEQLEAAAKIEEGDDAMLSRAYAQCLTTGSMRGSKRASQAQLDSNRGSKRRKISLTPEQLEAQAAILGENDLLGAWWGTMTSNSFLANGAPPLPAEPRAKVPLRWDTQKKAKRKNGAPSSKPKEVPGVRGSIYKNIDTLRRIRRTHIALLNTVSTGPNANANAAAAQTALNDEDEPKREALPERKPDAPPISRTVRPIRGVRIGGDGKKTKGVMSIPVEGGRAIAETSMRSLCGQLLEHAGFEGSSVRSLDMLTDIAGEFIMNMGRTIQYLSEQKGSSMNAEETILHTLIESGVPEVRDLESYIRDDVERYGGRLSDLERKLNSAWQEEIDANEEELGYDENLVEDDEALVAGDFSSALGDDFFGLKALGIDKEFGLTSLSVPSRLFHGRAKKDANRGADLGKPKEPALPYPPPAPFVPLNSHRLDSQIGLLRGFYRQKFDKLREPNGPPPPPVLPPGPDGVAPPPPVPPLFDYSSTSPLTLSDDQPSVLRQKMGPTGQVTVPSAAAANAASRKKRAAENAAKPKANGTTASKSVPKKKGPKPATSPKKPMGPPPGGASSAQQPPPPPPSQYPPAVLAS